MDVRELQQACFKTIERDTADALHGITRARFNGNRIECGSCGALLAKRLPPHGIHDFDGESATEFMRQMEPRYVKKVESHANVIEIKCKHRNAGNRCDTVNVIQL